METGKIIDLARSVATLSEDEVDFFEGSVRNIRADRAKAEEERIAKLRAMDDWDVVHSFLSIAQPDHDEVLGILRDAGFVRGDLNRLRSAHATLEEAVRRIVDEKPDHAVLNRLIMDAAANLSTFERS